MFEEFIVLLAAIKELLGGYALIYFTIFGFILLFSRFMIMDYKSDIWKKISYIDKLALSFIIGFIISLGAAFLNSFIQFAKNGFNTQIVYTIIPDYNLIIDYSLIVFSSFVFGLVFLFIKINTRKPTEIIKNYFLLILCFSFLLMFVSLMLHLTVEIQKAPQNIFWIIILFLLFLYIYKLSDSTFYKSFGRHIPLYEKISRFFRIFKKGVRK